MARHFAGFVHLRQQRRVDVQHVQQLLRPAAVRHIEHLHPGCVADFSREIAGQHIAHIVLRQENVTALGVHFRLVIAHPQQLRQREASQRGICRNRNQLIAADNFVNLVALRRRALVAPDNRRAQDVPCFIQHDQTVHLTADAHRNDVLLIHTGLRQHAADGVHRRMIPVLRLLLRPAIVRLIQRIFHQRGADRRAILVEQHRFRAGRAKVNTKNILHRKNPPLLCAEIVQNGKGVSICFIVP